MMVTLFTILDIYCEFMLNSLKVIYCKVMLLLFLLLQIKC